MSSNLFSICDIDLPPPPTMPTWLGSLCSQIDSCKDFTLPQVFTPRTAVQEENASNKRPWFWTDQDRTLRSSQLILNEKDDIFCKSQLNGSKRVFQGKHHNQFYNTYDPGSATQPETDCMQISQPWPSLQSVPERQICDRADRYTEDRQVAEFSQPWPTCDVKTPDSQPSRISKPRLTRSCLTSAPSSQNLQPQLGMDSAPDMFGNSPTYSPLASYISEVRQNTSLEAPVSSHSYVGSANVQSCRLNTRMSVAATRCTSVSGKQKNVNRYLNSADSNKKVVVHSEIERNGESATPRMGTHGSPYTPAVISFQGAGGGGMKLRSVEEIPKPFCDIFPFPFFNAVQSMAFEKLLYSDISVVVSAPTGSGKTALFELAIIRLLLCAQVSIQDIKVVYIGPMKSLCGERVDDWRQKLFPLGLNCVELTGDSDLSDFGSVRFSQVICTTPEKWDSVTRRWKDHRQLFQSICLVCIDEVHVVGDAQRGATVEAVITRMKMVHTLSAGTSTQPVRFVAVSATLPNTEDIGEWLSSHSSQAAIFKLGEEYRPVCLQRVVLGYPFPEGSSEFRFDLNLTYKLHSVIDNYSHGKPTLVFCSSRKSCQQTAETLVKRRWRQSSFVIPQFRQEISTAASRIQEKKLSELLMNGVGIHHAGLEVQDRKLVEELFRAGKLAVLIATSTLSVGVNLPAHLVVVKATHLYVMGVAREYSDQQVLQMIGRAGRPQFDTSATVVIMTKAQLKTKYEALVNGTQVIESMLHKNLTEHVNVEVVLNTITDMADAASWLSHTLLHVRATKNPRHYGLPSGLDTQQVELKLQDLCMTALNKLNSLHLVSVDPDTAMTCPTDRGRLMARYCLEFETVKHLMNIPLKSSIEYLIGAVSNCSEFQDIQLRTSEKKTLNLLNKNKSQETIRYPLHGKIKTRQMKVNCLVQAGLGCLHIQDYSLSQDLQKIFRVGQRITKCLMELLWLGEDYSTLLRALQLCKAFKARLWPDSRHVARQLEGIGPTISQALLQAGLTSFQLLEAADPHHLEMVVNRHPPFGNRVRDAVTHLPRYELVIQQEKSHQAATAMLVVSVSMLNAEDVRACPTCGDDHQLVFIIGDEDNTIVFKWKLSDRMLLSKLWRRKVYVNRALAGSVLHVGLISLDWVGLDIHTEYQPFYTSVLHPHRHLREAQSSAQTGSSAVQQTKRGRAAAGAGQPKEASGKLSSNARGQKAGSKIQQQLDVMRFKLQQFQRPLPDPAHKLSHGVQGMEVQSRHADIIDRSLLQDIDNRRNPVCSVGLSSNYPSTMPSEGKGPVGQGDPAPLQNSPHIPLPPWEEDHLLSPEVNLLTQPWGDLVEDFWDESDFDEPPSSAVKKTSISTINTGNSDQGHPVASEEKCVASGDREILGIRTGAKGNMLPTAFTAPSVPSATPHHQLSVTVAGGDSTSTSAGDCSSADTNQAVRSTKTCSGMKPNSTVNMNSFSRPNPNLNPVVRANNCFRPNTNPAVSTVSHFRPNSNLFASKDNCVRPNPNPAVSAASHFRPNPNPAISTDNHFRPNPNPAISTDSHFRPNPNPAVSAASHFRPNPNPVISTDSHFRPNPNPAISTDSHFRPNPAISTDSHFRPNPNPAISTDNHFRPNPNPAISTDNHFRPNPNPAISTDSHFRPNPDPAASTDSCFWPYPHPAVSSGISSRTGTNPVVSTGGCSRINTNPSANMNCSVDAPWVGSEVGYSAVIATAVQGYSSMFNDNTSKNAAHSSHPLTVSSAMIHNYLSVGPATLHPNLKRKMEDLAPDVNTDRRAKQSNARGSVDTETSRDPSLIFSRQKTTVYEQSLSSPEDPERGLVAVENVPVKTGFGWEHLQLYQSSRESLVNQDTQESSEGVEGWCSQSLVPEPIPYQLKDPAVIPPTSSPLPYQLKDSAVIPPTSSPLPYQLKDPAVIPPTSSPLPYQLKDPAVIPPTSSPLPYQLKEPAVIPPTSSPLPYQLKDPAVIPPTSSPLPYQLKDPAVIPPTSSPLPYQLKDPAVIPPTSSPLPYQLKEPAVVPLHQYVLQEIATMPPRGGSPAMQRPVGVTPPMITGAVLQNGLLCSP